jgi:hypothetical protein
MRSFFRFWWKCAKSAFRGNAAFANDWQWLVGYPIIALVVSVIGYFYAELSGRIEMTLSTGAMGLLAAAAIAFVITWVFSFIGRVLNQPVILFAAQQSKIDRLTADVEEYKKSAPKGTLASAPLQFATEADAHIVPLAANKFSVMFRAPMRATPAIKIIEPNRATVGSNIKFEYWSPLGFTIEFPIGTEFKSLRFTADARE